MGPWWTFKAFRTVFRDWLSSICTVFLKTVYTYIYIHIIYPLKKKTAVFFFEHLRSLKRPAFFNWVLNDQGCVWFAFHRIFWDDPVNPPWTTQRRNPPPRGMRAWSVCGAKCRSDFPGSVGRCWGASVGPLQQVLNNRGALGRIRPGWWPVSFF